MPKEKAFKWRKGKLRRVRKPGHNCLPRIKANTEKGEGRRGEHTEGVYKEKMKKRAAGGKSETNGTQNPPETKKVKEGVLQARKRTKKSTPSKMTQRLSDTGAGHDKKGDWKKRQRKSKKDRAQSNKVMVRDKSQKDFHVTKGGGKLRSKERKKGDRGGKLTPLK